MNKILSKMKKQLILFLATILLFGCDLSDCDDLLFSTGPPIVLIELVDNETEENIFTSELFNSDDIQIVNDEGNAVEFIFIDENNYNVIQFIPYSYNKTNTVFIKIRDVINVKLTFEVKEVSFECGSNYFIENLQVKNYLYEFVINTGILKIKI